MNWLLQEGARKRKLAELLPKKDDTYVFDEITCWIYCYTYKGVVIYVGQSIDFLRRHGEHVNDEKSVFDKFFTEENAKDMTHFFPIGPRTFSASKGETLKDACDWMNTQEIFYIAQYETYDSPQGMNMTKGGSTLLWVIEAAYKASIKVFTEDYMPAFEAWYEEHGHPLVPFKTPKLGHLLSDIRKGHTQVPKRFKGWFQDKGFMTPAREWEWRHLKMPAFMKHFEEKGDFDVSQRVTVDVAVANGKTQKVTLGRILDSLRYKILATKGNYAHYTYESLVPEFARKMFAQNGEGFVLVSKNDRGPKKKKVRVYLKDTPPPAKMYESVCEAARQLKLRQQSLSDARARALKAEDKTTTLTVRGKSKWVVEAIV